MQKKHTALSFLLLASMILLVFAAVPHHHHNEFICFNTVHCQHDGHARHTHDDSPSDSHGSCVRNLLQTQVSRIQSLEHSCPEGHCHHFSAALFLTADILGSLSFEADIKSNSLPFYREKLHPLYYYCHFSGRAPPYMG